MKYYFLIFIFLLSASPVFSQTGVDTDQDGISDADEIEIYKTDPNKLDTDGDGFNDKQELISGYSPLTAEKIKLEKSDYDNDGLSDRMELNFHTDLTNPDSDGDGYKDGEEINAGFDPLNGNSAKLEKKIEINTKKQELSYFLGGVRLGKFSVSSGKNNSTPKGEFAVKNKSPKAWSGYGLWMPYWLGLGRFGIHELPIWPNGYREGSSHLGTPVSHGCIRLGIGPAKLVYDWAEVGTNVVIY